MFKEILFVDFLFAIFFASLFFLSEKMDDIHLNELVDDNGCSVHKDDDNDGIANNLDKCPNTPLGKLVYKDGCPESLNLNVNFANDSTTIDIDSHERIKSYAKFLRCLA